MLKGFTKNGEFKDVMVTDDGAIMVQMQADGETQEKEETTLYAGVMTVGETETTIGVNKKVTQISIANYSEEANVTVSVDDANYVIGSNIATDLPINKNVGTVGISATEADTKVQYVIKGEE